MEVSNYERIGKALGSLKQGLRPYVEQKMQAVYKKTWETKVTLLIQEDQRIRRSADDILCEDREDVAVLLKVVNREWDKVFRDKLSQSARSLVNELIEVRNKWAHQKPFLADDTFRALDSVMRLLRSISAPQAEDVEKQRQEVLRVLAQEQVRQEIRHIPVSSDEEARIKLQLDPLLQHVPFQNAYLLKQALTHTTYMHEHPNTGKDNEQLEFLGDALLTFLSGDYLYEHKPDLKEGKMTVLRSNLVDQSQLARFATKLELGTWMNLGRGEDSSGGRSKPSLLSNVFEAVIGAYYLDSGIEAVRDLINPLFEQVVNTLPTTKDSSPQIKDDVKGWLQQRVLDPAFTGNPDRQPPKYMTDRLGGTDDSPEFTAVVYVAGVEYGRGTDGSKKEAEKRAAEDALGKLGLL